MNQSLVKADRVRVREHLSVPIRHTDDQMSAHGLVGRTDAQHVKTGSRDGSFGEEMRTEGNLRSWRKEEGGEGASGGGGGDWKKMREFGGKK